MKGNSRRNFLQKIVLVAATVSGADLNSTAVERKTSLFSDFQKFRKIDIHMHLSSDASYLRELMDELNLKMNAICNIGLQSDRLKVQVESAAEMYRQYPHYYSWCTTFGFDRMFDSDWPARVKESLKKSFDKGALGVKIWKEIGMQVQNQEGRFIQIDDPLFEPIFEYTQRENKTLFTHIGDPVDNWLSTGADGKQNFWYKEGKDITVNRIGKFQGQVSWENLMLARDRMIAKHPDLRIIGCHLLGMPHDVDLVARRLDRFPNLAVDTSLTVPYLMGQSREKVRAFFIRYQNRILYGLDESAGMVPTQYLRDMSKVGQQWTPEEVKREKERLTSHYLDDFKYYFTNHEIRLKDFTIQGLALPDEVLRKIFYSNALKWVPGCEG